MYYYETVLNLHWKTTLFVIGVTSYVTSQSLFPWVYSQFVFSMFISHAVFVTLTKNRSSVIKAHQKRSSALDPVVRRHSSCFQVHGHHERCTSRCSRSVCVVITRACVDTYNSKRKVTKLYTNSL